MCNWCFVYLTLVKGKEVLHETNAIKHCLVHEPLLEM